jgi:uncharacterized protein YukE
MSDDQISVNTDGMLAAAPGLYDLANKMTSAVGELTNRLSELGSPWGNDETGQEFVSKYQSPADQVIQGANSAASVLQSTADGVVTMAKGFEGTEQENKASINVGNGSNGGNSGQTTERLRDATVAPMTRMQDAVAEPAQQQTAQQETPRFRDEAIEPEQSQQRYQVLPMSQQPQEQERREVLPMSQSLEDEPLESVQPAIPATPATPPTPRLDNEAPQQFETSAQPLRPMESSQPTYRLRDATTVQPGGPLIPRQQDTAAEPVQAGERLQETPVQSGQPLTDRQLDTPAQPPLPRQQDTPAQPAYRMQESPAQPLTPRQQDTPAAHPLHGAERGHATPVRADAAAPRRADAAAPRRADAADAGRSRADTSAPADTRRPRTTARPADT